MHSSEYDSLHEMMQRPLLLIRPGVKETYMEQNVYSFQNASASEECECTNQNINISP